MQGMKIKNVVPGETTLLMKEACDLSDAIRKECLWAQSVNCVRVFFFFFLQKTKIEHTCFSEPGDVHLFTFVNMIDENKTLATGYVNSSC